MTVKTLLISCAVALASVGSSQAPAPIETQHISLALSASAPKVSAGGKVTLILEVTPKPKMHLYAPEQKDFIPVSLTLNADPSFKADAPKFPKGEKYFFEPLKETQIVFSKPFRVTQEVTLAPAKSLGDRTTMTISGTFRYQACDDAICYLPKNVPVTWNIPLALAR